MMYCKIAEFELLNYIIGNYNSIKYLMEPTVLWYNIEK